MKASAIIYADAGLGAGGGLRLGKRDYEAPLIQGAAWATRSAPISSR